MTTSSRALSRHENFTRFPYAVALVASATTFGRPSVPAGGRWALRSNLVEGRIAQGMGVNPPASIDHVSRIRGGRVERGLELPYARVMRSRLGAI